MLRLENVTDLHGYNFPGRHALLNAKKQLKIRFLFHIIAHTNLDSSSEPYQKSATMLYSLRQ